MVNIFDLIIIAIAVVIIVLSAKKGFVASCLDAFSIVISGFVSFKFYEPVAQWFYDFCVSDLVKTSFKKALDNMGSGASFADKTQAMLAELPESALKIANEIGVNTQSIIGRFNQSLASNEDVFVETMAKEIGYPVMIFITEIITFIVLMVLCTLLVRFISKFFSGALEKIPLVGKLDSLLGGVLGLIKGAIILVAITTVFYIILATAQADSPLRAIADSKIYLFLAEYNPVISMLK